MKSSNTKCRSVLVRIAVGMLLSGACFQIVCMSREMATVRGGPSAAGVAQAKEVVLYVSAQGNDAWSGRLPEPNAAKTDGPFATLERARDAIRSMRAGAPLRAPASVYVRGGAYALSAPLVFLPEDSGTPEAPITYASYPGEKVIASGGRMITGWKKAPSPAAGQNGRSRAWREFRVEY